jgi:uncharacterized protein with HEPN domain
MDVETYAETEIIHSAVERKFEIIREALGQLSKLDPLLARRIPDVRNIIAFRNLLIHGYAAVEHNRVWRIIPEALPNLLVAVTSLLDDYGNTETNCDRDDHKS